jgi:methionyl-tRNA formyltransferase
LFLGYDKSQTGLIDVLVNSQCEVHQTAGRSLNTDYDLVVCFGYRHMLEIETIESFSCPIINLHISYLPFNKGAHPNFWSFYEGTPAGVTIHLIDEGMDTGPILFQRLVEFYEEKTFRETYDRLKLEIERLFSCNVDSILNKRWTPRPQIEEGTRHLLDDLPEQFAGWDSNIDSEIRRLHLLSGKN